MNVLLTGASGFLGGALKNELEKKTYVNLSITVRSPSSDIDASQVHVVGDIDAFSNWRTALINRNVVIHTAARAHVMGDGANNPLSEYRRVNVGGTLHLAKQASESGVKRFIFISSIKVNGEHTIRNKYFSADDKPAPLDAYGQSKWEAEQGLFEIGGRTGMEVVVIRPPLIYGPGVKGNFASMVELIRRGLPLPLGDIHNLRTLVGVDNLVDLIIRCIDHPAAANRVLLAGDGRDVSTTELLRSVGQAMGRPARLVPVPASFLQWGANLLGKGDVAQRLLGSLQVDISQTRELLGWSPLYTLEEGLRRCFTPNT